MEQSLTNGEIKYDFLHLYDFLRHLPMMVGIASSSLNVSLFRCSKVVSNTD